MTTSSKKNATKAGRKSPRRNPAQQSSSRTNYWIIGGAVALGVVGLAVLLYLGLRPEQPISGVVTVPRPSREHDATLVIAPAELPPAGGVHNPAWLNCGIYDEPVPAENALHSMEHGAVWITYRDDLPQEQIDSLRDRFRPQSFYILSPYPTQRSPIVLTAWGFQLELDSADDKRIEQFVSRYRLGPTTPERGASCGGGVGEPLS